MAGQLPSRRAVLGGLSAGFALTAAWAGLGASRHALASDLALSDRIDLLYSNQFHFNQRGEPQITVGLMQGQTEVRLSAPGGLVALPSGDGGTAILGGRRYSVHLDSGRAARQRFAVAVAQLGPHAGPVLERTMKRWKKLGHKPEEREVGTLFGVRGRVLDARHRLVTIGDFDSEADATRQARLLKQRHGALGRLHPIVERRSEGTIVAKDLDNGVTVRAEGVLWFAARGRQPIKVHDVVSGTTIGKTSREDREYRGQIYVAIDRHGKLAVVNLVSETDLLAGLVPAEIFASAPREALKAQAVAARGQLVTKIGARHLDDPFLLCAEQHCQVYAGRVREHRRTTAAVEATAGWLLMRPGGTKLVDTVYSTNSGGHTEDNDLVWPSPSDPQLRGRPDPMVGRSFADGINEANLRAWLESNPPAYSRPDSSSLLSAYRWRATVDPSAVAGRPGVPAKLGAIRALSVLERGKSGRAIRMRVTGERGEIDVAGELLIRRALGDLKSSMFLIENERDAYGRFRLLGGGHGHGVGLCQHGAMGMAGAGRSHRKILAHYYRGSKTAKLW
jgi:SpoIID/LytB domain protein